MVLISHIRRWLWRLRGIFYLAPAASALATACLFVFLVQLGASRVEFAYGYRYSQVLASCFGLSWPLLSAGFFWQPLTYLFLHAGWLHLGFNAVTILLFGSGLEMEVGARRFWRIFLAGGVLGGLGWLGVECAAAFLPPAESLTHWMPQAVRQFLGVGQSIGKSGLLIGASGGVFALIGAYAALFPTRLVYVLLVVFPVKLKARSLAVLLVVLDLAAAVFVQSQIAYAAHLTGCLAGYLYGARLRRLGAAGERD